MLHDKHPLLVCLQRLRYLHEVERLLLLLCSQHRCGPSFASSPIKSTVVRRKDVPSDLLLVLDLLLEQVVVPEAHSSSCIVHLVRF